MNNKKIWNAVLILAVITVFYNVAEGLVSVFFGFTDETLALFGFGIDSVIEVLSGLGIWYMVIRIKNNESKDIDSFQKTALKITGISFYILTISLILTVAYNFYTGHKPETTFWGIVISSISILTMIILTSLKLNVGKRLHSDAVIADANNTKTCVYLSILLLASSLLYEIFKIGYIDSIGALGIAFYAFKEGREAMEKTKTILSQEKL
jgi:divalent metal cation (Fe/Co/Zn/Cd) transporter